MAVISGRHPTTTVRSQKRKRRTMNSDVAKNCKVVLENLMRHNRAHFFYDRIVDGYQDAGYFNPIDDPMDLRTVQTRLDNDVYVDAEEFESDVRLTFDNAMIYAPRYTPIHQYAKELMLIFEDLYNFIVVDDVGMAESEIRCKKCASVNKLSPSKALPVTMLKGEKVYESQQPNVSEVGSKEETESTSKELRAAMLKKQFALTIVKAQQTMKELSKPRNGVTQKDQVMELEKGTEKMVAEVENEIRRLIQKERQAARMALEKLEQSVDVEDKFSVMKEMEALVGYSVAYAPLWCS